MSEERVLLFDLQWRLLSAFYICLRSSVEDGEMDWGIPAYLRIMSSVRRASL
jgi:hypothetical protein